MSLISLGHNSSRALFGLISDDGCWQVSSALSVVVSCESPLPASREASPPLLPRGRGHGRVRGWGRVGLLCWHLLRTIAQPPPPTCLRPGCWERTREILWNPTHCTNSVTCLNAALKYVVYCVALVFFKQVSEGQQPRSHPMSLGCHSPLFTIYTFIPLKAAGLVSGSGGVLGAVENPPGFLCTDIRLASFQPALGASARCRPWAVTAWTALRGPGWALRLGSQAVRDAVLRPGSLLHPKATGSSTSEKTGIVLLDTYGRPRAGQRGSSNSNPTRGGTAASGESPALRAAAFATAHVSPRPRARSPPREPPSVFCVLGLDIKE